MTIKFKLTLNISHEEMIRLLARYAPFEITSLHEIMEDPTPKTAVLAPQPKKNMRLPKRPYRRPSISLNLKAGVNRIIMETLSDGKPHRATEVKPALVSGGFSANSVGSRLQHLEKKGIVKHNTDGTWELAVPATE